ncbi:hypothetical protein [Aureliella helgolandensis]|uniref:Uncharacterized protein n=1 Tax=Aureliella helgolandensis TaxID=2527968 RepID=A0A518G469_9BACT|nr:hypothetical protein [Aureliella helgolandensis]QDV23360.1 hypothetical protein Q31a_16580 [Aureliella helgolandensis]
MKDGNARRPSTTKIDSLATGLLQRLQSLRHSKEAHYPLPLAQLASQVDATARPSEVLKAARSRSFMSKTISVQSSVPDSPIALVEDLAMLAKSEHTLSYVLEVCSRKKTKAHTVAELVKTVTTRAHGELQRQFRASVEERMKSGTLPKQIGFIAMRGGRFRLFRLEDLEPKIWRDAIRKTWNVQTHGPVVIEAAQPEEQPKSGLARLHFHSVFESAFTQLDQAQGGYNFVSLDNLRTALSAYSREEFDAELRKLRLARRYRLSGAENRSDVSCQQREAGIVEAGSLLLYAQRISS